MKKLVTILSLMIISFSTHANVEKIRACSAAGRYADFFGGYTNTDHCMKGNFTPEVIQACESESRYNNIDFNDCLDKGSSPSLIRACGSEYRYNRIHFFKCLETNASIDTIAACGSAKRYSGANFYECVASSSEKLRSRLR